MYIMLLQQYMCSGTVLTIDWRCSYRYSVCLCVFDISSFFLPLSLHFKNVVSLCSAVNKYSKVPRVHTHTHMHRLQFNKTVHSKTTTFRPTFTLIMLVLASLIDDHDVVEHIKEWWRLKEDSVPYAKALTDLNYSTQENTFIYFFWDCLS